MTHAASLIVDDRQAGLFRVNRAAFTDPEVLELERRRIFDRTWLYACHETELPDPGSFVARNVGGRPLLIVRDQRGDIGAFLNSCPHRGNVVCREPAGKTTRFICFYHAWSFGLDGALLGVPGRDAYSQTFFDQRLDLPPVPRLANYRGLVFVSFNKEIEDIVSYLAGARDYVDQFLDYGVHGCEVAPGSQSYSIDANWKLLVENSIDGYHAASTHQRYFRQFAADLGMATQPAVRDPSSFGKGHSLGNGHAMVETKLRPTPLNSGAVDELQNQRQQLAAKYGEARASKLMDSKRNLLIFPNLIFISSWRTIRTFYPIASGHMEIDAWMLLPKGEEPALKRKRLENFASFLGPAGMGTPDDISALEGCQRGFESRREAPWSDISRGMTSTSPSSIDELQMRAFWRRWHDLLQGKAGPTDCSDQSGQVAENALL